MSNPFSSAAAPAAPAPAAPAPAATQAAPAAGAIAQPDGTPAVSNLSDMFNNGTAVGGDKLQDDHGAAVLIRPVSFTEAMSTQHGPTDAIQADWIVLDGPNQGQVRQGLVFPSVIVKALKNALDRRQLSVGVVARGEARGNKSAPWLLEPLADDQLSLAGQAAQAHGWV